MATKEERAAVKEMCDALAKLNKTVERCGLLGIDVRLEKHDFKYLADCTKTERIYP